MAWFSFLGAGRNRRRPQVQRRGRVMYVRSPARGTSRPGSRSASAWNGRALALAGTALLVVAVIAIGFFVFRQSSRLMLDRNARFAIRTLDFSSDGKMTPERIREYAGVAEGDNLFALDLKRIQRNLKEVPLVRSVRVQRALPGTLRIKVIERVAVARIPLQGGAVYQAVDSEGFVIGPSVARPHLPQIIGIPPALVVPGRQIDAANVRDALSLIDICDRLGAQDGIGLRSVDTKDPDTLVLTLDRDDRATLGRTRLEDRIRWLSAMLKAIETDQLRGTEPLRFDVRGDSAVAISGLKNR